MCFDVRSRCSILLILAGVSAGLAGCSGPHAQPVSQQAGIVQQYGQLQVKDGQLCDQHDNAVQLRGMSSHDLARFPLSEDTVDHLARDWHVSVIRAAMYTDSYGSSYIKQPRVKESVKRIIDAAIRNGIYVIVDWHILQDGNPNQYLDQAKSFFREIAAAYRSHPNIIYEICNEPNGTNVSWKEIKTYAESLIPAIRALDPKNIIIVGTDTWSQGVQAAAEDPLTFSNVVYALHFYAGTHRDALRKSSDTAVSKGLPIFVTEWGLSDATGRGPLYLEESQRWLDWMNAHKISWANWSFSNENESSAALVPSAKLSGPWTEADLTASGRWVKSHLAAPARP